jgi:peptidoglycan/xylan/chitin deacetylase (PgdA/CDA1 family)
MSSFAKQSMLNVAQSDAFEKLVSWFEHRDGRRPGLLRVLTYHRVDSPAARPWLDPNLISATPEAFEEQMQYISTHYQVVAIADVISVLESGDYKKLPARAVVVTFDDAYFDFAEHAWPTLKRYGIPATLFVPTAYPDQPERTFWWDDLYNAFQNTIREDDLASPVGVLSLSKPSRIQSYKLLVNHLKTLQHVEMIKIVNQFCNELGAVPATNCVLGWDALRKLADEGVTLGAHTRTHPLMNRVTLENAQEEAVGSWRDLEHKIGSALPIFAYPSGGYSDQVSSMLEREGFKLAFTTERGINPIRRANLLQLRRINVGGKTTLPILRAQLLPLARHLNRLQPFISA